MLETKTVKAKVKVTVQKAYLGFILASPFDHEIETNFDSLKLKADLSVDTFNPLNL